MLRDANTFDDPLMWKTREWSSVFNAQLVGVTLSSVTLNFELKKVVLSSCLARLLLVPVHFIESEH